MIYVFDCTKFKNIIIIAGKQEYFVDYFNIYLLLNIKKKLFYVIIYCLLIIFYKQFSEKQQFNETVALIYSLSNPLKWRTKTKFQTIN